MKAARVREWSASQRPAAPGLGSPAARGNGGVKAPGMARMQCRPQCHPYVHTQALQLCSAPRMAAELSGLRAQLRSTRLARAAGAADRCYLKQTSPERGFHFVARAHGSV